MSDKGACTASAAADASADRQASRQRAGLWSTLAAISAGGVIGALGRHGITTAFPHPPGTFAWATAAINIAGCLLIGMLMVALGEIRRPHRLVRPFLGVGVLGGFTTFSAYIVDAQQAIEAGAPHIVLAYLASTLIGALAAVYVGAQLVRALVRHRSRGGPA